MSVVVPCARFVGAPSAVVAEPVSGSPGSGEAAVVISVIAAVTVLAFLACPIPMALTLLAGSVMVLLVHRRAGRLLAVVAGLAASGGGRG
ncbi:hypothetical protein [Streptomyces sp. MAI_2237]